MKKQYRILTAVLALTLVNAMPAAAQDVTVLMQEMNDIREDLKILQRQMYNDGGSELVVTVGRLDELVRSTAGREVPTVLGGHVPHWRDRRPAGRTGL